MILIHFAFQGFAEEVFTGGNDSDHIEKILVSDPGTITERQFYQFESAIMSGYSGSGGYYLDEPLIQWLKKAEDAFKTKGVRLKDKYKRDFAIADSYFNHGIYDKALEEFKNVNNQEGVELAEWFVNNDGIKNGPVKINEYPGKIPCSASKTAKAEDGNYKFAAYFKGPIYRYDKKSKKHAIIYAPEDKYDWCNALAFDGSNVVIKLRDDAGTFIFDNKSPSIFQLKSVFNVEKTQVTVFFGPDFYDLEEVTIDNLKISPNRLKIAFKVWGKSKEVFSGIGIVNTDGSDKKMLTKDDVENFTWFSDDEVIYKSLGKFKLITIDGISRDSIIKVDFGEDIEISKIAKSRLDEFVGSKYKNHYGISGGFVQYGVKNYIVSPDKRRIAFLVIGEDGHKEFYPAWHVCDFRGESITLIDETETEMSNNVVWLSDNEIEYIKDARLWKAIAR